VIGEKCTESIRGKAVCVKGAFGTTRVSHNGASLLLFS
jgi:hypothetical protein